MRPLRAWPRWRLDLVVKAGWPRALLAEVWIELHERVQEEAAEHASAAANDESGPWLVTIPRGLN